MTYSDQHRDMESTEKKKKQDVTCCLPIYGLTGVFHQGYIKEKLLKLLYHNVQRSQCSSVYAGFLNSLSGGKLLRSE